MPNFSSESVLLAAIKSLVGLLPPSERGRLRVWIEARFDARGYPAVGIVDKGTGQS